MKAKRFTNDYKKNYKTKNALSQRANFHKFLKASNALDCALSLGNFDTYNASLSALNGYNNINMQVLTLQYMLMTYLPKTYGVLDKIIRIPVDDAYRDFGFDIEADTLDEDDIKQLQDALIENEDLTAQKKSRYWARQFGGAALIAVSGNDLSKPLIEQNLYQKPLKFMPVDRWQLSYSENDVNIPNGNWFLTQYNAIGQDATRAIHPSRVFVKHGKADSFLINQQVQGWGVSVFESIFQDISLFFKGRNSLFELIDESKVDIIKLSGLQSALMSTNSNRAIKEMLNLIANNLNYKSKLLMSTDDDYVQKQIGFSGVADILKEIRIMIAGSANIPVNKLWGEGVTGFGSGEDSLENYNSQIENEVRSADFAALKWMFKLRCYQLFGREVEDLTFDWKPLRVLSAIDEQNIQDHKLTNVLQLFDRQLLTPKELMIYLKRHQIFVQETKALKGELEDVPLSRQDFDETKQVDILKQ